MWKKRLSVGEKSNPSQLWVYKDSSFVLILISGQSWAKIRSKTSEYMVILWGGENYLFLSIYPHSLTEV